MVKIENSTNNVVTTASAPITLAIGSTNAGGTLACTTDPVNPTAGVATFAGCAITGTAGNYNLSATSTGLTTGTTGNFTINAGAATQLMVTTSPGNSTNGVAFSSQPVVMVEDASGNVVTTSSASISLSPSSGSLACSTNPLNATAGVATFTGCSLTGSAGPGYILSATSSGLISDTSNTFSLAVGPATQLVFTTTPGTTNNGATFGAQPVVQVEDSGGNLVTSSSASVNLSIASGTGTLNCTTNPVTASSGVATFAGCEITGAAGTFTLSAVSSGLTTATSGNIPISGTLKLVFTTSPGTTNNGVAFSAQPVVAIENSSNAVVTTASAPITLSVASGSGTVACTTNPVTASSGVATFAGCAITGIAGSFTLSAVSTSLTIGSSTNFTINAGSATQLVFSTSPGNSTNGVAFSAQPVVKVEDASGNVVTTSSALISLTPSSGALACTTNPLTASSGVATFAGCAITGTAGSGYSLSTTSSGLTGATSSPTFSLSTGSATKLVVTTQPSTSDASGAALAIQPVVKVEDSGGNVVTTDTSTVTASFTSGGVSLTNPTKAAAAGVATFSGLTLNALAGPYTLTFSDGGLTTAVSNSITVSTGSATQLVVTTQPSSTANSGAALGTQPVVKVEDSGGNVVTSVTSGTASASIASGAGGSIAAGGTSGTFSSGVATFSGLALNGVNGTAYTLTFTGGGFTSVPSSSITVSTGSATKLVVTTQPSTSDASGAALAIQPVVKVEDSGGNVVTTDTSTVTASFTSGGVSLTNPTQAAAAGVATFSGLALNALAGPYTLTFSDGGLTTAVSNSITVSTGSATKLVVTTQPSTSDASGAALAIQPVVKVEDSGGNVVTTDTSTVTASFTSGGVSLTNPTKAAAAGVATFSGLTLNALAGPYTLTFSDGGLTTAVSNSITVSTGSATQLVVTTQPSSTANSGAALGTQPVVKVEDSGGNVVTSVTSGTASASIASGAGGSIAAGGTSGTFSSGVATFSGLALNGVNGTAYTLTFTGGGFTSVPSSSITVSTGSATKLVVTTQPSTSDASGAALAIQPVVKVEDSGGNVVTTDTSTVTASFTSGGVSLTNPTQAAAAGVATFSGLALNALAGPYTLTFSDGGLTTAVSNSITVSTGSATKLVVTTQPSTSDASGAALAIQPVVKVEDSGGNVVTTDTSTVTASFTSGGVSLTNPTKAAAAGVATFSGLTLNALAGPYTLTFSDGGLTTAVSNSITVSTGSATQLVVTTQPSSTANSGAALGTQPVVKVEDSGGNVVTSVTSGTASASIASGAGGSIAAGGTSGTFSSGVATFSGLALNGVNGTAYTLTFTGGGFTSVPSSSITVSTGSATKLVFATSPGNSTNGVAFSAQPVVQVEDSGGNVVTGSSASIMLTASSGTLGCTTNPLNASSGVATFAGCSLTGTAGSGYSLSAASSGLTGATSSPTFSLSTGSATQLVVTTQPSSTANSGAALGTQPVVKVEDSGGNVVTSVTSGTASASIASGAGGSIAAGGTSGTFSSGVATFSGLALNGVNGTAYTLTFTGGGFTSVPSSSITVSTGSATKLVFATSPGNSTNGVAFSAQPVVQVEDSGGNVVTGSSASIMLTASSGTLGCTTNPLNASSGVATFAGCSLTGTAGSGYSLSAASSGLTGATSSPTFSLSTGSATQLVVTTQPSSTANSGAALGTQPVVKVEDSGGNVVTSVTSGTASASIASGAGGSIAAGGTSGTFSSGVATFSGLALNGVNGTAYTLTFTGGGFTSVPSSSITVSTGSATKLVFATSPGNSTNGVAFSAQPVVQVEDSGGNVVTGSSASIMLTASSGTLGCTTNPLNASSGVATFAGCSLTGTAGSGYSLSAASSGLTGATSSPTFSLSTGSATQLVVTTQPSSTANSGAALGTQPVVKVEDSGGNVVTSVTSGTASASIASGAGGSIAAGGTSGTFSSGVATFSGLALNGVNGTAYTLTFTGGGFTSVPSSSITVSTGSATKLVFATSPGNSTNGVAFSAQPVVQVEDSGGNVVTGSSASIMLTASSGTLGCTTNPLNASSGVATFAGCSLTGTAGSGYSLSAASSGLTGATSSPTFSLSTGAPTELVFTSDPSSQAAAPVAGTTAFVVQVEDSAGNVVVNTGSSATVTPATTSTGTSFFTTVSGGSTGSGTVSIPNGSSSSNSFYYADDTAGTWSISATATVDGIGVGTSLDATVDVTAANPTLTASGPATGNAGTTIDGSAVSSTMVGSSGTNATASITFTVFGPGSEPTSCTSGGTTLGTATPAGDGTYTSSGTFTPALAGNYWLYASSAGDANNNAAASACASGMSEIVVAAANPTLTASGPATGNAGTTIDGSAVSSTMVGSSGTNATASITFTVFGPGSEPTSCTSEGTTLGTATPAGDGTYTSSGTFTPTLAGNYWLYASSAGDANNNAAASACDSGMSEIVVAAANPTLTASGPATGNAGTTIDGSAVSSTMVGSSGTNATASITFTVFGPGSEPTSCTSGGTTLGTATPAGDGTYTSSGTFTPALAGNYWLYASSAGDANNNAAASACASGMSEIVVGEAISATSVTSSANPATYGDSVTLTATVTGLTSFGAPTGTVAFTDGSSTALVCGAGSDTALTPISSSASSATCLYTPPVTGGVGGTFSTIGTYSGDGSYTTSAGALAQEVLGTLATPGTTVFSANPSPNGAPVTMNGTLTDTSSTANPATAAGSFPATVTVFVQGSGAVLCTNISLTPTGPYMASFSCTFTPTGPGTRLILRSVYSGDDAFAPSSYSSTLIVAGTASTTPSVVASATTVALGGATTLQTILTGSPAPTGNVTFLDNGSPIAGCGLIVVQSGVAQTKCAYIPTSVGSHSITATYSGDVNYAAAGPSAAATVIVTGTTTSATATPTLVSPAAPVPNGDPITVSTVVSGSGATPTGTVAFSATIGSSTSTACSAAPVDGSGMASCTFTPAFAAGAGGTVSISAVYSGDDTYGQSTSSPLSVNVLAIGLPSTFTLTTSKGPISAGSSAVLTAVITGTPKPTGTVIFYDNGAPTPCGAVTIASVTGKAVCTYTPAWGTHSLVATYSGNASYAPITQSQTGFANAATLVVNSTAASTVAVTSSANPSATGAAITFGATVTGAQSAVPTGTVTFSVTIGGTTTTVCAAVAITPSTGTSATASCTYTPPDSGNTITVTEAYSGDPTYAPQSGTLTQTELGTAPPSAFTLTTTKGPLTVGSSATLTAALTGSPIPKGTVSFTDNGSPLSCGAVTITTTGKATCTYTPTWGTHTLVATYSGNATYAPVTSSTGGFANSATLVVNSTGASTVAVTSSANPSVYGAAVTFTATVTGSLSSAPTGTIAFTTSAGTLAVGCAADGLTATGPTTSATTCVLTPPTSGTGVIITVNASYSGDPTYAPEVAAAFSQTETGTVTPSITLTSSANPASSGSQVTFTATLTAAAKPGTVTFTDNGTAVCTAVLIANTGKATCVDTVSGTGVHTIVAAYTGNATYAARQVTLNQTVS